MAASDEKVGGSITESAKAEDPERQRHDDERDSFSAGYPPSGSHENHYEQDHQRQGNHVHLCVDCDWEVPQHPGQAQHAVRELADLLEERGVNVRYAIHEVAGRMPGHMNVLLAEANVPYDQLFKREDIEADFKNSDVAVVIGANDVTNPAARHDTASPIYGMPILDVDKAATAMVLKRSMRPGFAGVNNELYTRERTMMVFGDAQETITNIIRAIKEL